LRLEDERKMTLRFRRSVLVAPGVRLSLGMHGAGLSVGPRGLHVGLNRHGAYASAGVPGSAIYMVRTFRRGEGAHEVRESAGTIDTLVTIALLLLSGAGIGLLVGAAIDGGF